MKLVDTPKKIKPSPKEELTTKVARDEHGAPNFDAYIGLTGTTEVGGLNVFVRVVGARARYGHLDLRVVPIRGWGERWVERKNVVLINDPAETYGFQLNHDGRLVSCTH